MKNVIATRSRLVSKRFYDFAGASGGDRESVNVRSRNDSTEAISSSVLNRNDGESIFVSYHSQIVLRFRERRPGCSRRANDPPEFRSQVSRHSKVS